MTREARLRWHWDLLTTLLYPTFLGAGLLELAYGIRNGMEGAGPTRWALAFAAWFCAYHLVWWMFLKNLPSGVIGVTRGYEGRAVITDYLELPVFFWGISALGLLDGASPREGGVFLAVALIVLLALISNLSRMNFRAPLGGDFVLFIYAIGVPLSYFMLRSQGDDSVLRWSLLGALVVLLVAYIVGPEWFHSLRSRQLPKTQGTAGRPSTPQQ